jgi:hypothetical protein
MHQIKLFGELSFRQDRTTMRFTRPSRDWCSAKQCADYGLVYMMRWGMSASTEEREAGHCVA